MIWTHLRVLMTAAAILSVSACDRLSQGPQRAPVAPPSAVDPQLRNYAGESYPTFVATAGASYSPDALGFVAADRARLWRAMASPAGGGLLDGGGTEALVFQGCAETGCAEGAAVVAIDTGNGAVFAGVRDAGGVDILASNERLEALLRLNSPSRSWDNLAPASSTATP